MCQPCDVCFYRQVKNYIGKFHNCQVLIAAKRELSSREDCIKMHALIHNQLQAPIYRNTIKYAWYAAKLITPREVFCIVNQVAFPDEASFRAFAAFTTSTIPTPASPLPKPDMLQAHEEVPVTIKSSTQQRSCV
ncbi:hypothetical protein Cfor_09455 [Coptotermes formosanus]|uniref:Uncharacterized protein n=1 Tax=Coptotermes formosanus TaxID=36987 RepID=A0A6L2PVU0_COPFO|nr:hypothetical protein Cfor_09455 [Coptotermes formosanus]